MRLFQQFWWLEPLVRTVITLAAAWLIGHVIRTFVAGRLTRLASESKGPWDDVLIKALQQRLPLWTFLIGVWLSIGYWPLPDRWARLLTATTWVLGFASVTFALASVAAQLVGIYGPRAIPGANVSALTRNVVRLLVIGTGLLVVLNEMGIEIRPMLAALGVGGLAVALALQEPLSNLFAGLVVSMAGHIRIGDQVKLDSGLEGRIVDFNWRSTWLQTGGGSMAIVPNSKISQAIVTNYNLPTPELVVTVDVVVSYKEDLARVERLLLEVAAEVAKTAPAAVPTFTPTVVFLTFGKLGVEGVVVFKGKGIADQGGLKHAFISKMVPRFQAEGIEIPSYQPVAPAPEPPPPA
jgi:small-conductance mechanosensitive channel